MKILKNIFVTSVLCASTITAWAHPSFPITAQRQLEKPSSEQEEPKAMAQEFIGRVMTSAEITSWNMVDTNVATVLVKNINNKACSVTLKKELDRWQVLEYNCWPVVTNPVTSTDNPRRPSRKNVLY